MTHPFRFQPLLESLNGTEAGVRLGRLAAQIKIEQVVLAEAMLTGNEVHPELDFFLEEDRRDLTVRRRADGCLLDWVEAKMCYSDCLARGVTKHAGIDEYCAKMLSDAEKQEVALEGLPWPDKSTALTSVLFVLHRDTAIDRQKYYPAFRNRRDLKPEVIEQAALAHVRDRLASFIRRAPVETFQLALGPGCRLHVFVLRLKRQAV